MILVHVIQHCVLLSIYILHRSHLITLYDVIHLVIHLWIKIIKIFIKLVISSIRFLLYVLE